MHHYCPCEFCLVRQWGFYLQSPSHPPLALCCGRRLLMWCGAQTRLRERGRKRNGEETFSSSVTSAPPADWTHYGPTSQPGESHIVSMHTSFPQLSRIWQHSEFDAGYLNEAFFSEYCIFWLRHIGYADIIQVLECSLDRQTLDFGSQLGFLTQIEFPC